MKLTAETLQDLDIQVPAYDRARVTPGIVHFGVGGFHRAHQAVFIDRVLAEDPAWGIVGVGLMPNDRDTSVAASHQQGLYTLTTLAPDESVDTRVIGSILDVHYAPDDPSAVLDVLAAPTTRIVTLTITEGGYGIDDSTGEFDPSDPLTLADLGNPLGSPVSVWGFLTAALRRRRDEGAEPFSVVSCDNIQGNGHVARLALTSFARRTDAELASWIDGHAAFPNSMVDRITPTRDPGLSASVQARTGVDDEWPVLSESFLQWVIEDEFSAGRPALEAVGVQVVEDVAPYERMKLRLLNASHQAMGYLGLLAGFELVDEACSNSAFRGFLLRYMHDEAVPTLGAVPGVDLDNYCDQLMDRFSSRAIRDTLARQVVDGSDRLPKFLLPVLQEQLEAGGPIESMALVVAGWSRYLERHLDGGTLPDRRSGDLLEIVAREPVEPGALLRYGPVFGTLGENERFVGAYLAARTRIAEVGALAAVEELGAPT